MRYYNLDVNGRPLVSYARPQPGKDLQHLPEQPSEHHRWDGERWVESQASLDAEKVEEAKARLRELDRELCDGCEALMEHIGPERLPEAQRERLEAKRAARERIQKYEEGGNERP